MTNDLPDCNCRTENNICTNPSSLYCGMTCACVDEEHEEIYGEINHLKAELGPLRSKYNSLCDRFNKYEKMLDELTSFHKSKYADIHEMLLQANSLLGKTTPPSEIAKKFYGSCIDDSKIIIPVTDGTKVILRIYRNYILHGDFLNTVADKFYSKYGENGMNNLSLEDICPILFKFNPKSIKYTLARIHCKPALLRLKESCPNLTAYIDTILTDGLFFDIPSVGENNGN